MDKDWVLIVNLSSGTARQKYEEILPHLDITHVFEVDKPKKFKTVYKQALKMKPKIVVLAGGDGTIIKGIESLVKLGYKGNYGILPFGTANYLARDLGIPLSPVEAMETIKNGSIKKVPLATVNGSYFALMMTVGLSRSVSKNISNSLKRRFGQLAYVAELFKQSAKHEPFHYEIEIDGRSSLLKGVTHQLIVYNANLNQQVKLLPDHDLTDPSLRLAIPKTGKRLLRLYGVFVLHVLSIGRINRSLKSYKVKKLTITTKPVQGAGIDGEVIGKNEFNIEAAVITANVVC